MSITDIGRAHCIRRLNAATSLQDLQSVWGRLGVFPKNDPAVLARKDQLKARFEK